MSDEEFAAKGNIVRLIDGEFFFGKTDEEIQAEQQQTRPIEIENKLQAIDAKSSRAARAVALAVSSGKTPAKADVQRLEELEAEATELRAELKTLTAQAE